MQRPFSKLSLTLLPGAKGRPRSLKHAWPLLDPFFDNKITLKTSLLEIRKTFDRHPTKG